MKKTFLRACLVAVAMMAMSVSAQAAESVKCTSLSGGTTVAYGVDGMLSVESGTYGTSNTLKMRYASGVQECLDTPSKSVRADAVNKMGVNAVAVPGSTTGKVYNVSKSNGMYCSGGNTLIAWANVGQPDSIAGCAFHTAILQAS